MDPAARIGQKDAGFVRALLEDKPSLFQKLAILIDKVPGIQVEEFGYPVSFFRTQVDISRLLAALIAPLAFKSF